MLPWDANDKRTFRYIFAREQTAIPLPHNNNNSNQNNESASSTLFLLELKDETLDEEGKGYFQPHRTGSDTKSSPNLLCPCGFSSSHRQCPGLFRRLSSTPIDGTVVLVVNPETEHGRKEVETRFLARSIRVVAVLEID